MKIINISVFVLTIMVLMACNSKTTEIDNQAVDSVELARVSHFNQAFFSSLPKGDTMQFEGLMTDLMLNTFNKGNYANLYNHFDQRLGTLNDIAFVQAVEVDKIRAYNVYRFKAGFSKHTTKWEIRAAIDTSGLIAAYSIIPWQDEMFSK
jgi:hypothetical protein